MFEVIDAVSGLWGSDHLGLRISPLTSYNDMIDSDPVGLATWLAKPLNPFDLAYLDLMRGDFFGKQQEDALTPVRANYKGVLIGNLGYIPDEAAVAVAEGKLDGVAFGTGSPPTQTCRHESGPVRRWMRPILRPSTHPGLKATRTIQFGGHNEWVPLITGVIGRQPLVF